jgi:hypothetical protein
MKTYEGMEIELHMYLMLELGRREGFTSCSSSFMLLEKVPDTN